MNKIIRADGTFLFDEIIFGPLNSRRFGKSLGVNLLPSSLKVCNFDCIYCECGFTDEPNISRKSFYTIEEVREKLNEKITELIKENNLPDCITFAGNGEPTLHPDFFEIIKETKKLRDAFLPNTKLVVLTNAAMLNVEQVKKGLELVDMPVCKLDAGTESMFKLINHPYGAKSLQKIVRDIINIGKPVYIQSFFLKGVVNGVPFDNTGGESLDEWMKLLLQIKPKGVMLYSLDRKAPVKTLEAISYTEMEKIAARLREKGLSVVVS